MNAIEAMVQYCGDRHQIYVLTPHRSNIRLLQTRGIQPVAYKYNVFHRGLDTIASKSISVSQFFESVNARLGTRIGCKLDGVLETLGIDLVVFNEASAKAAKLVDHNFVFTIWDVCHRDWPEFREVYAGRKFERREQMYRRSLPKAVKVIAESAAGAERIANLYQIDRRRIVVAPFIPTQQVRDFLDGRMANDGNNILSRLGIQTPYVFYPAQFWPHKNHAYILDALSYLRERDGYVVHAAFSGGDRGNLAYLKAKVRDLDLDDQVHFLGFIDDADIPPLYQRAAALVMPTYFGPTNIPPVEAHALGCPVIYSDFPSFRAQCGDAALYCDLSNPVTLASHILTVLTDPERVKAMVTEGRARVADLTPALYGRIFGQIFDDYAKILATRGRT